MGGARCRELSQLALRQASLEATVNWEALSAIAELLGAIGVLASLLYLATQIRQNTVWLRQQAFQQGTNEVRRWASHFSESHANSELFLKGQRDFSSLDPIEHFRFTMMIFELCSVWGTYQEYSGEDLLGLRDSAETLIGIWIRQGWFEGWWERNEYMFSTAFKAFVRELIARRAEA
jgi:hypothetical protein